MAKRYILAFSDFAIPTSPAVMSSELEHKWNTYKTYEFKTKTGIDKIHTYSHFDIHIPKFIVKYNKIIFSSIYVMG